MNFNEASELIKKRLAEKLRELPTILGEEAKNFSLDRFKEQAWLNETPEPWQKRRNPTKWGKPDETDRALLVKTGTGRRSVRITRTDKWKVWIGAGGADVPYMKAHNFGFKGRVQQTVRPFTRKMKNGKTQKVKGFTRVINQNIPKRQFLGNSMALRKRLQNTIREELNTLFR